MTFMEIFNQYAGMFFGVLGAALAIILAGTASAQAVQLTGEAAAGVMIDEPEKFARSLLFQLLPGTQGLYGFVIALLISLELTPSMNIMQGLMMLAVAMPVSIVGITSARAQAKVAIGGINILIKNEPHSMKGVVFAVMVETYAILAFVTSILLLTRITG